MWMPKDTATWLALSALILAIPFNLFASWVFPKLQNWWAIRSRKSLQERIDKLTASLKDMDEHGCMSEESEWILLCAERLALLIYLGVVTLIFIAVLATASIIRSRPHPFRVVLMLDLFLTAYNIAGTFLMMKIRWFRRHAGPMVKDELEMSVADLKAKLASRKHPRSNL